LGTNQTKSRRIGSAPVYSVFKLRRSEAEWLEDRGEVLVTWHIFNPNGPTVSCVGLRETGADDEKEVFWRWMHFTGGEDYCLGYVNAEEDEWGRDLLAVLGHAFGLEAGGPLRRFPLVTCVPSAVTLSVSDEWAELLRALFAETTAVKGADWGCERYRLTKYGSRLFDRAGEEYREAYENLRSSPDPTVANSETLEMMRLMHAHKPTFADWLPGQYVSRALQDGDVGDWWAMVTSDDYLVPALNQLACAWVGASHRTPGTREMIRTGFEDVRDFMSHYRHPLWPEEWTTASIAKSMGLDVAATN
jgi:hypothetical protein